MVPVVVQALVYEDRRGNYALGAHVRDAACYVCWSFARAYAPEVIRPHVRTIAGALLVTTVFDREVNCRRAASAAFQVGSYHLIVISTSLVAILLLGLTCKCR